MEQQTAVEWLIKELDKYKEAPWRYVNKGGKEAIIEQAKQMEKEQKIKAQIEILRAIGNNGMNAPLYGILKDNLIILEEQLTKL